MLDFYKMLWYTKGAKVMYKSRVFTLDLFFCNKIIKGGTKL